MTTTPDPTGATRPTAGPLPHDPPPLADMPTAELPSPAESDQHRRALAISRTYRQRQPLSNSAIVARIIGAAIKTGRWNDQEITAALLRLADEDRRLTHETLRIELTYRLIERSRLRQRGALAPESVVYVIGCDESPLVKIGTTTDLMQRLHDLQRMCPVMLRVLHQHPGGYELENALHRRYRSYRKHGEWFDFGRRDPVVSVMRAIADRDANQPMLATTHAETTRAA